MTDMIVVNDSCLNVDKHADDDDNDVVNFERLLTDDATRSASKCPTDANEPNTDLVATERRQTNFIKSTQLINKCLEFQTPKYSSSGNFEAHSSYYYTKFGRDLIHDTPVRPFIELGIKNMSTQYSTHNLDNTSNNILSYNTFVGKLNTEYFSSTLYYKKLDDKINEIRKSIASTSTFDPNDDENDTNDHPTNTRSYYNRIKSKTTRSAFESDPDQVLATSEFVDMLAKPQDRSNILQNYTRDVKQTMSNQNTVIVTDNETAESTHTDSDDALAPQFELDVYGSRKEPIVAKVIYDKKKSQLKGEQSYSRTDQVSAYRKDDIRSSRCSIAWDLPIDEHSDKNSHGLNSTDNTVKLNKETQTSLIDARAVEHKSQSTHVQVMNDNKPLVDNQQKIKVKEIIRKQKQEHERRMRTLEKLAKLERLQADKLKQMMILNDMTLNETETTMMSTSVDDTTLMTNDETVCSNNGEKSKLSQVVEVIDLTNTTVVKPPNGYSIVKEKKNLPIRPTESNGLGSTEADQTFVSIPNRQQNQAKEIAKKKNTAWFEPIGTVSSCNPTHRYASHSTPNIQMRTSTNVVDQNKRPDATVATQQSASAKLSLQEAFEMFNYKFISKSRRRLKEMKLRAEERQHEEQFKRERLELGILRNMTNERRNNFITTTAHTDNNLYFAQKRQMTLQQIKEQTEKVYKKLPEVQQRMRQQKVESLKKHNRIKSSVYNKTIQQRVLTKGPNFSLNFKALEYT